MEIKNFWVDVENGTGTRLGAGPLRASSFTTKDVLSASGEFSFRVSAADPNLNVVAEKRIAVCRYVDGSGQVVAFGGGIIDVIKTMIDGDGSVLYEVSGNNLARELTYRSVGALGLVDEDGMGVLDGPEQIMALAPEGWSILNGETVTAVYAGFNGESVLNALVRVGEHIGEHWRLSSGRVIQWLGQASGFASSGVRGVQHVNDPVGAEGLEGLAIITGLEEISDAAELVTRVIPRGSGNGGVALDLAGATDGVPEGYVFDRAANTVTVEAAEAEYGRIEHALDFKEIGPLSNTTADIQAAANMMLQASVEHLRRYSQPQKFYTVELAKVDKKLEPGTTMRILYRKFFDGRKIYDIDGQFNIISVESRISDSGIQTTGIEISTIDRLPQSDASFLAGQAQSAKVFGAHQQLGASVDTFSWRDELDSSHSAGLRFWLGQEYTTIQRAVLRFKIQRLRSTVKSVASGGGSSQTSSSGGGGAQTSSASVGNTDVTYLASVPGSHLHGAGSHYHSVSVPSHTHSVEIPAHTHSQVYGIYEESSGNTLALANLVIKLNGGADLRGAVVSLGSGWYELDITAGLVNDVYRPKQESNEVVISTSTANKTARIEAQMTIRGVVQAVAYS
jgi:hypothetical protein